MAFDLASVEQRQQQAEIDAAIQRFAEENRITDPENLSILLSLIGMGGAAGERVAYTRPGWADWLGFGMGVTGPGGFGMWGT